MTTLDIQKEGKKQKEVIHQWQGNSSQKFIGQCTQPYRMSCERLHINPSRGDFDTHAVECVCS